MRRDKRLAYQGKIQALLKEWGSQIDRWQERAKGAAPELVADLNRKRQAVVSRLAAMKKDTEDQWQSQRPSLDRAVDDMREAVSNARDRFRQI
jgi:hypothetical protein